jgi:PKD repeat protein
MMMRIYTFIFVATFIISTVNISAQPNGPWVKTKNTPDKTFAEYQQEFYDYWEGKTPGKGQGFKQFKRWEYFWETRVMEDGTLPTSAFIWDNIQLAKSQQKSSLIDQSQWEAMGPFDYELTGSWSAGHGRVNEIVVDPNDPNTIYVGAPAGGIWKSTDVGQTWEVLNDDMGVIGVSAIAIDPSNSNVIYIGTGDDDAGDNPSIGVMKTIDGGVNWNTTGLVITGSAKISKLLIDPDNTQTIYAATDNGLFKSIDGGDVFTSILSGDVRDLAFKPGGAQTIYAVTSLKFYRSIDSGVTFDQITSGIPTSGISRIVIGVSPAQSNVVYLLFARTSNAFKGIYRSSDSGSSFELRNNTTDIFESTQAWYDLAITVDSEDADVVYTGVLNLWKSSTGGTSFFKLNSWSNPTGNSYTHADIHFLGSFNGILYCGSDGGIYRSSNGGSNFQDLSPGLQIGQFYKIDGTEQNENTIAGGLQDNGGYYTNTGSDGWKCYYGADGMDCAINPSNQNIVYGSIQFGSIFISTNGGNNLEGIGSPETGAWVTPIAIDLKNHESLIVGYSYLYQFIGNTWRKFSSFPFGGNLSNIRIAESNPDIIYMSLGKKLFKTTDRGITVTQITGLPNLSITDIAINNTNADNIWVTIAGWFDGDKVYKSVDGGESWVNISGSLPNLPTNCIAYQNNTDGGVYVGNDFGMYYYNEIDGDWIDYSDGLPRTVVSDIEINNEAGLITVGTYGRGIWRAQLETNALFAVNPYLKAVENIEDIICGSEISPQITVKNVGTEMLTSFDLEYSIGNNNQTYSWTGNLASSDEVEITLDPMSFSEGISSFQVQVVNPNGGVDEDIANSQMTVTFESIPNGEGITVQVETDCWGGETTWEITDVNHNVLIAKGPFNSLTENNNSLCLNSGCYRFVIYDSKGDGLAGVSSGCGVNGNYLVTDGAGNILVEMDNANFGHEKIHEFCVGTAFEMIPIISSNATLTCENSTIDFQDLSFGSPTSWSWEFEGGNPATSSLQNPQDILYENEGVFDVSLTIMDNDGNTVTQSYPDYITIMDSPVGEVLSTTDISCFGAGDGMVSLSASEGTPPYFYTTIGKTSLDGIFTDMPAGNLNYMIFDENTCSTIGSYVIEQPDPINIEAIITDVMEGDDGAIELNVTGGTQPFIYAWSNGSTDQNIYNLSQGNYTVVITDANGCTITESYAILVLGISEILPEEISVYPNPASDELFIDLDQSYQDIKIELLTNDGKITDTKMISNGQLIRFDVSELSAGTYFIRLFNNQDSKLIKVLLVK